MTIGCRSWYGRDGRVHDTRDGHTRMLHLLDAALLQLSRPIVNSAVALMLVSQPMLTLVSRSAPFGSSIGALTAARKRSATASPFARVVLGSSTNWKGEHIARVRSRRDRLRLHVPSPVLSSSILLVHPGRRL
jgi:hypothetical protein